jgi:hypothetical protein
MRHEAEVLHQLPGRTRIRIAGAKGNDSILGQVAEGLRSLPEVQTVKVNAVTGSLLIAHDGQFGSLADKAAEMGLFILGRSLPAALDFQAHLNRGLQQLERDIQTVTGGNMDFNGVLILAFTALAIQQAIEGQVVVPAATALWYALNAAQRPKGQGTTDTQDKQP